MKQEYINTFALIKCWIQVRMHFKTQLEPQLSKSLLFNYTYALFFSINTKKVTCDLAINTTFNFGSPRAGGLIGYNVPRTIYYRRDN